MYNTLEKFTKKGKSELNIDTRKNLIGKKGVTEFLEKSTK